MNDDFNPADIGGEPTDAVVVDKRGTLMRERESYERVIEGLKMASDGAQHLAQARQDSGWARRALSFDNVRKALAKLGSMGTEGVDATPSQEKFNAAHMGIHAAYDRVYRGLDMAAKGARQVAACHRGDLRWSRVANTLDMLRDDCSRLIRVKQSKSAVILPAGFVPRAN